MRKTFHFYKNLVAFIAALQIVWFFFILLSFNKHANAEEAGSEVLALSVTMVEVVLGVLGLGLALIAFLGYGIFKKDVEAEACKAAKEAAKAATFEYLQSDSIALIRKAIGDDEFISQLQVRMNELGLDDEDLADFVDTDAEWTEDE
ncbi:hypothetical protein [Donghicola eburneus]|mgnify:CR=1 FL=1|uniref:Putative membrane protein n=1 Tax=Donghicola eburneus TaxID=393278 RepID=A0A1M4N641_9RHOB|nr:hypothetical protein [Donghicola eburneus]SCM69538.1 putative membrane protein [Donghicola eburneus]SFQ47974.1 hypothetical protein SAMN05421764_104314 [Donghicola eburneus]